MQKDVKRSLIFFLKVPPDQFGRMEGVSLVTLGLGYDGIVPVNGLHSQGTECPLRASPEGREVERERERKNRGRINRIRMRGERDWYQDLNFLNDWEVEERGGETCSLLAKEHHWVPGRSVAQAPVRPLSKAP